MLREYGVRLVDLSIPVEEGANPIYPQHPWLTYRPVATHATGVFESNCVELFLHAGSHVDAPYHFDPSGARIDELTLDVFVADAYVLDISDAEPEEEIGPERLHEAQERALEAGAEPRDGLIGLVRTDWSQRITPPARDWWQKSPYLNRDAADWLLEQRFSAVGFDFPQDKTTKDIDRLRALKAGSVRLSELDDPPLPVHVVLLSHGISQIENITNLDQLPLAGLTVVAAPILMRGAEGAPARVFALVPDRGANGI